MEKPIKYTCADCAHHICSCVCVNGTYACNGDCKVIEQKMKCDAKRFYSTGPFSALQLIELW